MCSLNHRLLAFHRIPPSCFGFVSIWSGVVAGGRRGTVDARRWHRR
jgi:hypothetical protein